MASVLNTIAAALILGDANNSDIDVSNVLNQAPLIAALNSVQIAELVVARGISGR